MGLGDDEAEIVEDVAETLPGGRDGDAESDGGDTLGAPGGWLCGRRRRPECGWLRGQRPMQRTDDCE